MRRRIGRRALFFAVASLACVALVPATPPDFRWVAWATAGLGAFWAILLGIEDLSMPPPGKRERWIRRPPEPASPSPFEPPPPPDLSPR
jgi:hypothetical protein